jgi:aryl-alcohol dehydrogenase-like predicted oxidoreductase
MEYRNLGRSGLQVTLAGLGTNNFGGRIDYDRTVAVIDKCLDLGVTFFDTADTYGGRGKSEEFIGRALEGRRHEVILATKFSSPMGEGPMWMGRSRRYVMNAVHDSLRRLRTDYIDLYQVHFPNDNTPAEETMRALDDLVRAGDVRYIGCSNYSAWQLVEANLTALHHGWVPFVSAQNQYSLLDRRVERELLPVCERYGVSMLPYFPLASGFLTGKYRRGEQAPAGTRLANASPMADRIMTERNWAILDKLETFAADRGKTVLDVALAWLAAQPAVASVIAGATRPEQVEANVRALEWKMTPDEVAEVAAITSPEG